MNSRNIAEIKPNPKNPRVIKDDKYLKLVESLRTFPQMLEKRPLVCVTDTVDGLIFPLGGNMRLRAAKELKMANLPVTMADDWTEEQRHEFIIKDNVGYGEWDWQALEADWDAQQLSDWGVDLPVFDTVPDELTADNLNKLAVMKITFPSPDELQECETELQEVLNRLCPKAFYSVSAGEL